jgi:hypothetical protein
LQPERDVGRVADDLGRVVHMTRPCLADDRHARVHSDADAKRLPDRGDRALGKPVDGDEQGQTCPNGRLSLVLRCEGISEAATQAVADVVDDVAAGLIDAARADRLELEQNLAQVLRVATFGETR